MAFLAKHELLFGQQRLLQTTQCQSFTRATAYMVVRPKLITCGFGVENTYGCLMDFTTASTFDGSYVRMILFLLVVALTRVLTVSFIDLKLAYISPKNYSYTNFESEYR